jgi:protein phosphatase
VRSVNQDLALVEGPLVAVADGMGGHAAGEVAAAIAINTLRDGFAQDRSIEGLVRAAERANEEVYRRSLHDEELRGMGTTLTAAALVTTGANKESVAVINIGDSRAYVLDRTGLKQITHDHSLVEEMVQKGEISAEEALVHPHRHILTRALGIESHPTIDSWSLDLVPGARLLLCSDGLTNECSENEIDELLTRVSDPQQAAEGLLQRALDHGGADNITVVVLDLLDGNDGASAPMASGATSRTGPIGPAAPSAPPSRADASLTGPVPVQAPPITSARSERPTRPVPVQRAPRARRSRRDHERVMTPFVALFLVAFLAIVGGLVGFTVWYNNASYYVGLSGNRVAIFEGRPGGLLWFKPSLVEATNLTTADVLGATIPELRSGILESSFDDAKHVVGNLSKDKGLFGANLSTAPLNSTIPTVTTITTTTTTKATHKTAAVTGASGH